MSEEHKEQHMEHTLQKEIPKGLHNQEVSWNELNMFNWLQLHWNPRLTLLSQICSLSVTSFVGSCKLHHVCTCDSDDGSLRMPGMLEISCLLRICMLHSVPADGYSILI